MLPIDFQSPAKKYIKKLKDQRLKKAFEQALTDLRNDPYLGEAKRGDLAGFWGMDVYYQGTNYEIAYVVSTDDKSGDPTAVVVFMAGTRENFWDALKQYIR